jgi:hypothetical protein
MNLLKKFLSIYPTITINIIIPTPKLALKNFAGMLMFKKLPKKTH